MLNCCCKLYVAVFSLQFYQQNKKLQCNRQINIILKTIHFEYINKIILY